MFISSSVSCLHQFSFIQNNYNQLTVLWIFPYINRCSFVLKNKFPLRLYLNEISFLRLKILPYSGDSILMVSTSFWWTIEFISEFEPTYNEAKTFLLHLNIAIEIIWSNFFEFKVWKYEQQTSFIFLECETFSRFFLASSPCNTCQTTTFVSSASKAMLY